VELPIKKTQGVACGFFYLFNQVLRGIPDWITIALKVFGFRVFEP